MSVQGCSVMALGVFFAGVAFAGNGLFPNGGFEDGVTGWKIPDASWSVGYRFIRLGKGDH